MFLRVIPLAAALWLAAGHAAAQSRYVVREVAGPAFRPTQVFFRFEDISSPPFVELRRRFAFAAAAEGATDDFDRILRLRHWIFTTLKVDFTKPDPPHDAFSILAQGPSGGPFECSHAMIVQNAVMNAMGHVTRCLQAGPGQEENTYLASGNHGVNEIWSNRYAKWVLSDAEFDGHFEKDGTPLSALEVRDEYLKDGARHVDLVVGPERKKTSARLLFSPHCYRFVAYEMAGDRHTQSGWTSTAMVVLDDEYFRTHPWWRWQEPDGGKPRPHWALRSKAFLPVARREWIEWTPNVTSVKAKAVNNRAQVRLESNTPNFDRYEMRQPGGAWVKTVAVFSFPLEGPRVEREFRAVNTAGVAGTIARLLIERE